MEEGSLKAIPGYDGYFASKEGFIYSNRQKNTLHRLKGNDNKRGYLKLRIFSNGKGKSIAIHRIIASMYIQNKENYEEVNHIDGNKLNNSVDNLEWCTRSQNMKHACKMKLLVIGKGEESPRHIHSKEKIIKIKNELKYRELSLNEIAKKYQVSKGLVCHIKAGRAWSHITV